MSGAATATPAVRRVFVCDDQPDLRRALSEVIQSLPGFEQVGEAGDGERCITGLRSTRPDILILDVNMPQGGAELAGIAKAEVPDLKIVVFSAMRDESTREAMYGAGVDDYVVKTGRLRPLRDALHRVAGLPAAG